MTKFEEPDLVPQPKGPDASTIIRRATRPDGSINWAQVITALAGLGISAGIGAAAAGGKGALAGLGQGLSGLTGGYEQGRQSAIEEEKLTLLGRRQTREEKRDEEVHKSKAPTTRTSHDAQGNEILEEWDARTQTWKEVRRGRKPEISRTPPHTQTRQRYDTQGNIHYEEKIDGKWTETAPPGKAPSTMKLPKEEKGPTSTEITAAIKDLDDEEKEIKARGKTPTDASGKTTSLKKVYDPEDQIRLDEIAAQKKNLRSMRKPMIKLMAEAEKVRTDTSGADTPKPITITGEDFKKLQEAVRIYREKGLTDDQIRSKLKAKNIDNPILKMLGL